MKSQLKKKRIPKRPKKLNPNVRFSINGLVILTIVFMLTITVGYAALNTELNISGEANFRVTADIRVVDYRFSSGTNDGVALYNPNFSKDTIITGVYLPHLNSTVTFEVKVINFTSLTMLLESIDNINKTNPNITYTINGIDIDDEINGFETKTFTITFHYPDSFTSLPASSSLESRIQFNFVTKQTIEIPPCDVVLANGDMGGTNPAPWTLCDNGIVIISGGTALTSTGVSIQSRFPAIWRPYIERIVLIDTVIGGANLYDLFGGLPNLTTIDNIHLLDTTNTRRFTRMFANTPSLVAVDLSSWNTPNLEVMYRMFYTSGVQRVNLGGSFNPVNVTNMGSMFWHSSNLTTIGNVNNWDTSNLTRTTRMFQGASSLQSVNLSNWDTSNVTLMYHMFSGTHSLTSVGDLSNWNTSSVTRMDNMFANTWSLTTIGNISNWNVSSAVNLNSMFNHARSITSLNLSNWDTRHITGNGMNLMFGNTTALREITLGENWWVPRLLGSNPSLPVVNNTEFTGRWRNVGSGTTTNPTGAFTPNSSELMDNSLGTDIANTWVWEPRSS